jgi:hypothetical protein
MPSQAVEPRILLDGLGMGESPVRSGTKEELIQAKTGQILAARVAVRHAGWP